MIFAMFMFFYATTVYLYERELDEAQCEITCEDIENFPDDVDPANSTDQK